MTSNKKSKNDIEEDVYRNFISRDVEPILCHEESLFDSSNSNNNNNNSVVVSLLYKCRDLDENSHRTLRQQIIIPQQHKADSNDDAISSNNMMALSTMTLPCNIISYIPSTSGIFQAHFIRISSSGKDEKYGLEIWKESSLLRRINLPSKPCVAQGNMDTTWFGGSC